MFPLADLMPEARARGLQPVVQATALDTEWRNTAGLGRLRDLFDLVVLNREVAHDIVGPGFRGSAAELVRRIDECVRGPGAALLLTLGAEGAVLFDAGAAAPALLAPGDQVRFDPVAAPRLAALEAAITAGELAPHTWLEAAHGDH